MNSEELELSLRTEFENYLKGVLAEVRQEATELQQRIEGEFDAQRNRINEAVAAFAARFDAESQFDEAFKSTVAEHLRLARDEGAAITANAFAEAEKLEKESAPPARFDGIRDAVADITSKDSQSAILKSLVEHAEQFAPRGAFFIIKNENFTGWKVFGSDSLASEHAIRDLHFPLSADSILGTAVKSLSTVDSAAGAHAEDAAFLEPLQFGHPDRMYAIPLVARGKGVAVMYADYGSEGVHLNREALETLVRVAGLTVELIALAHAPRADEPAAEFAEAREESFDAQPTESEARVESFETRPAETESRFEDSVHELPAEEPATGGVADFAFSDTGSYERSFEEAPAPVEDAEPEPVYSHEEPSFEPAQSEDSTEGAVVFDSGDAAAVPSVFADASPFDTAAEEYAPAGATIGNFEPAVEVASPMPVPSRLSDRPVDLPIEVPEEERRLHNDARRFARLLVSEIKLYNERKVIEGRESSDLYDRLREAIDRSREMYDKRVQPPVAAKFDYFHYELVNALADGDTGRLGSGYPGAAV